ncbi:hypothetical protein JL720_3832 [Aureococcus anophagefferens]|nr:hypothetical protein JL720_3832 [Aureococcus anophagefferens]
MSRDAPDQEDHSFYEDTPAYKALKDANVLETKYRRSSVEDIFTGTDVLFVPAGHVGLLMDGENRYLFAQPGMHNIQSIFIRSVGTKPLRGLIQHGNRTIVVVEQGYLGYARDNGQPVLLPPGIHVWTSESLDHKNWRFEKFMTLKIQTDELERIEATSADNINMTVTSTVNWRIKEVRVAATMAAETMNSSGTGTVSADISKLRRDVLKQAIASLAGFIGSVNYSNSFHVAAAAQASREAPPPRRGGARR